MTSRTGPSGETTAYTYSASGNLKTAQLPDGRQIEYLHDAAGRRIAKQVDGQTTNRYLYAPEAITPVAEVDESGNATARFVYGTSSSTPDYIVKGSNTYRVLTDQLGSVRMVVNSSTGTVAQEIKYDEFGRILSDSNPGFQPFGFAGGLLDSDTGLTHFGAREYDSVTGRFTSKDPIGFAGGDLNLYGYVLGDPVNWVDPSGLWVETAVKVGVVGVACVTGVGCVPAVGAVFAYDTGRNVYDYAQGNKSAEDFRRDQLLNTGVTVASSVPGLPLAGRALPSVGRIPGLTPRQSQMAINGVLEYPGAVAGVLIEACGPS